MSPGCLGCAVLIVRVSLMGDGKTCTLACRLCSGIIVDVGSIPQTSVMSCLLSTADWCDHKQVLLVQLRVLAALMVAAKAVVWMLPLVCKYPLSRFVLEVEIDMVWGHHPGHHHRPMADQSPCNMVPLS